MSFNLLIRRVIRYVRLSLKKQFIFSPNVSRISFDVHLRYFPSNVLLSNSALCLNANISNERFVEKAIHRALMCDNDKLPRRSCFCHFPMGGQRALKDIVQNAFRRLKICVCIDVSLYMLFISPASCQTVSFCSATSLCSRLIFSALIRTNSLFILVK